MFIPGIILLIIIVSLIEKVKTYDLFVEGVKEGFQTVINLFPTLIGLMLAVDLLRSSGCMDLLTTLLESFFEVINIPKEISVLALLRPISGSACIAYTTDLFKQYGINSYIGIIATVIMGSTETTVYALSVYTGRIKEKVSPKLIILAVAGNVLSIILSMLVCKIII